MRRAVAVALVVAVAAAPGCTVGVRRAKPRRTVPPTPIAPVSVPPCRTTYARPDPKRPHVRVTFDVDSSYTRVTGTEHVVFTPDRPVTELVFRLWANGPGPAGNHGRIEVTSASLPMAFEPAGAGKGTQGTLLRLALPAPVAAGKRVTADLAFTLTLPDADVDRWGHTKHLAWWGSAQPQLAWVRGHGWQAADAEGILGETWGTEAAVYDVTVTAPFGDEVLSIGPASPVEATGDGRQRWHFANPLARDVAVTVGRFATRQVNAGSVPVTLAVSEELQAGGAAAGLLDTLDVLARTALRTYARQFGPYPFPALSVVAIEPVRSAGVEYPGLVWVGSRRYDVVVPHELGHQWFYGLVGDDQAGHPWLDEAFASYAEALVNDGSADRFLGALDSGGKVGAPMSYWDEHGDDFGRVVYAKGAAALLTARSEIGADAFDALLRCYVNTQAYRVAYPEDFAAAMAPAPSVAELLREVGAL